MDDELLPGRILERITGLDRDTFRHWACEGLLHPTLRKWKGRLTSFYDPEEVGLLLIDKALANEKCAVALVAFDLYLGWAEERQVIERQVSQQQYTTSVDFELCGVLADQARRLLPAPARPVITTPEPARVTMASPTSATPEPARVTMASPTSATPEPARVATAPTRPPVAAPAKPLAPARVRPTSAIPTRPTPWMSQRVGCWNWVWVVLLWSLLIVGAIWLLRLIFHW